MDIVHVRWANCPARDFNHTNGKESYPLLGFECITDFNHRIMSIYGPHFGLRNDMDIVKMDKSVEAIIIRKVPLFAMLTGQITIRMLMCRLTRVLI